MLTRDKTIAESDNNNVNIRNKLYDIISEFKENKNNSHGRIRRRNNSGNIFYMSVLEQLLSGK
jgi:hypothetical protein